MIESQNNHTSNYRDKVLTNMYKDFRFNGTPVTVFKDGGGIIWFIAKQVCDILGISNSRDAISHLDDDEKDTVVISDGTSGNPHKTIITESGLYMLIMRSRKPEAHEFQRWVTHEVLPQIRKTGGYIPQGETPEETMARAVLIAQKTIANQKKQLEEQKPKVLFADTVSAAKTDILVGDLAKILRARGVKTGGTRLFQWMRDNGYLIHAHTSSYNMPTQRAMELGLFHVKETSITHSDGHTTISKTPKVTGRGQVYFVNKFLGKEAQ